MTRRNLVQLFAVAPAFVRAQTMQEKGRKIMEDAQLALGGSKFLNMKDRTETGRAYSFYRERLSGLDVAKFETFYDDARTSGVKQSERHTFGKKQDYYQIFDGGGKGWDVTYRGTKPMPEEIIMQWQEALMRNAMYILRCRYNEKGMIFERRAAEVYDNQPVEIVDVIDSDNRSVAIYFHQTSKLPIRAYSRRQNPKDKGWDEQNTTYAKYRAVGGLMWPWSMSRSRNGDRNLELYSDDVKFDSGLSASNFQYNSSAESKK